MFGQRRLTCEMYLFERVTLNLSTRDDSRVGYVESLKKKEKQETEIRMLLV